MARYRKVECRIWNDEKFRELSDDGKLIWLFLLTHPAMTSIGAMRATVPGFAAELSWKIERLSKGFTEVLSKGMAKHDERACCLWLPKFLRYNPPENPNVLKSWANSLDLVPECSLKTQAIEAVKDFSEGLPKAFAEALPEAFRKGLPKGMPKQEQEQEQEQEPKESTSGSPLANPAPLNISERKPKTDGHKNPDPKLLTLANKLVGEFLEISGKRSYSLDGKAARGIRGTRREALVRGLGILQRRIRLLHPSLSENEVESKTEAAGKFIVESFCKSDFHFGRDPKTSGAVYDCIASYAFGNESDLERWLGW